MARPSYPFTVRHRDVWTIALPATLAFITEPLAGIVDLTVIGRLGDANLLGGLVLGALAFDVIFSLAFFLRLGTAGLVAQSVGARDPHDGLIHFARATLLGVAIGLLLLALTVPLQWGSAILLGPEPGVAEPFETYLSVRMWSAPLVLINFALLGWFYGRAAATTGMLLQIVVHGGNIIFSILFVYGLGWGVAGVALGTVIGELLAALAGLYLVMRHFGGLAPIRAAISLPQLLDPTALRRLFALSRDLMIRSAALMGAFVFFTAQTAREGAVILAANAVVLNFQMVTAFFLDGQAQAAEQLCGKAVGANYRPAFDRAVRLATGWGLGIGVALFAFWLAVGPFLVDVMTTAPEVRLVTRDYLFIGSFTAITGVMAFVMDGVMIGATLNIIIRNGMIAAFLIFLASAIILQPIFGVNGLWAALHIFFISRGLIYWLAVRWKMPVLFPQT